jgi:hypothetical protein
MKTLKSPPWLVVAALLFGAAGGHAEEALRAEIGLPLHAAQDLMKSGKNKEALVRIREAEAVANRTAFENYYIDRLRGGAATAVGDNATAMRSYEAVLASGRLQSGEQLQMLESMAATAFRAKDYAHASEYAQRYFKLGGSSESMRGLQVNAHYQSGDFAGVARSLQAKVDATERSTPAIDEQTLLLLASSYQKLGDEAGYAATLERLLVHHPKKAYWVDLLAGIQGKAAYSDRLALDVYRLLQATDNLSEPNHYVEMAQLALEAGLPAEAKKVVDAGFAAGKLGQGPEAERHKRLRDMATRQVAEDLKAAQPELGARSAEALVLTGQWWVSMGQLDKGIVAMESGINKGGLKRPEEARLHLGQAYLANGNKTLASATFKAVKGADGLADLARLWSILSRTPA